jgi:hypothetical protein
MTGKLSQELIAGGYKAELRQQSFIKRPGQMKRWSIARLEHWQKRSS